VTSVLLVGQGAVGIRAARQIVDTPGVDRLVVAGHGGRAPKPLDSLGPKAEPLVHRLGDPLPDGLGAVAAALPAGVDHPIVTRAVEAGVPVASADDDHGALERLLDLDERARTTGATVVAGCALAPGLAEVLARHAGALLEVVDEVRVARYGAAGPACRAALRSALQGPTTEWRGQRWDQAAARGEEHVWFPEPVTARDCQVVAGGVALLATTFPTANRLSYRCAPMPREPWWKRSEIGEWGAVRVEVWGRRAGVCEVVVYGVIERTAVAAGTVLGVTAALLAGALGPPLVQPGVHGLGVLVEPVPFLLELAERGIRAAVFEGAPVS